MTACTRSLDCRAGGAIACRMGGACARALHPVLRVWMTRRPGVSLTRTARYMSEWWILNANEAKPPPHILRRGACDHDYDIGTEQWTRWPEVNKTAADEVAAGREPAGFPGHRGSAPGRLTQEGAALLAARGIDAALRWPAHCPAGAHRAGAADNTRLCLLPAQSYV